MITKKETAAKFDGGYNVIITGRHVQVTDGMRQHAIDKVAKLEHIGDQIIDIHVTMDIQKVAHRVTMMMKYGHTVIKSQAETTDMYVSIDQAVEKIALQLRKYKDRIRHHHTKELAMIEVPELIYELHSDVDFQIEHDLHKQVSVEQRTIATLTDDEAIMKLELSDEPVIVFHSPEKRSVKVAYRKSTSQYGIIETKG